MINRKNVDIKAEKEGKREKDKKIQKKSFTKGRGDGNINRHSTRESSETMLLFSVSTRTDTMS